MVRTGSSSDKCRDCIMKGLCRSCPNRFRRHVERDERDGMADDMKHGRPASQDNGRHHGSHPMRDGAPA